MTSTTAVYEMGTLCIVYRCWKVLAMWSPSGMYSVLHLFANKSLVINIQLAVMMEIRLKQNVAAVTIKYNCSLEWLKNKIFKQGIGVAEKSQETRRDHWSGNVNPKSLF